MRMCAFGLWSAVAILLISICGCSSEKGGAGTPATAVAPAESSGSAGTSGIQPCKLLTASQVTTVLPEHDGGTVAHAGMSLMKAVDAYQCSYSNKSMGLLTVILNVAQNDEAFSWIKPSAGSHSDDRKIDVGDGGWLYGEENDLKVRVLKGRTVIDLELMDTGARTKSEAMIELARVIAGKIP